MKISVIDRSIRLSQDVYTNKILSYGMQDCCTVKKPMVPNTRLMPATSQEQSDFQHMVLWVFWGEQDGIFWVLVLDGR
jgi:hypothetical protein